MAGFTMSMAAGFNEDFYGKSLAPITMCLEQGLESFEQQSILKSIFSMRKSKNYAEKMIAVSAMDNFSPVGENGAYTDSDFGEVFSKTIEHFTWKNRFSVSREMIDESKLDLMRLRANKFTQAYGRTRETFATTLLTGATANTVAFGGRKWDTTTADGVALFSKQHPNFYKRSQVQSNLYAGAFSASVLGELETKMQMFEGDKGEILTITPDTIIIPNDAALKNSVFAAIGADKDPNTSNNGFNYQYGRWNVVVVPYWKLTGSDKPFILMDSKFNDLDGTALFFDRIPLDVKAYVDNNNDAAVYQGYSRFSVGFNNWRGMLMGGVASGTAL